MININETGVWHFNNEMEFETDFKELFENPDFFYIGEFISIQDIYSEMSEYGFEHEQVLTMSQARYGDVIEIMKYKNKYFVFVGAY